MTPQLWYQKNSDLLDSQFEHLFFDNVLSNIAELNFSYLQAQTGFIDDDGKQRYCDFTIAEGQEVRIAIEVDGYDKRGTGGGMTHAEFVDWQRRQTALTSQGWHVLRFANRDVVNEPLRCCKNISALLTKLRQKEAGRSEARILLKAHALQEKYKASVLLTEKNINQYSTFSNEQKIGSLPSALAQKDIARYSKLKDEKKIDYFFIRALKKIGLPIILAIGFLTCVYFFNPLWLQTQLQLAFSYFVTSPQICTDAVHWSEVMGHLGQTIKVEGPITRINYRPDITGKPTWIEVGSVFPDPDRLTLLIWGDNRSQFEPKITLNLLGNIACVTGELSEYQGSFQIQLQDPEQLTIN
ncbi:DUF559 domain-containing protein [Halomonas glaciei]|uniref:DUF559 domain-containing protein n=1 Tax=Vreelandella glaciei TaxID=186761 RepID=A0A7Z0LSG9_9GAMM|nr:DUF559 domain-containing protein [Halomonas glaciei]NYS77784.1 DUF559 domain-containing protein [Halomonas glaciei]